MDIGSIFLILALFIPVMLFILRPVIERSIASKAQPGQDISSLMAERDHVIASIKELDDDYNLGKIPVEEYPTQRQVLLQNGADILREIDNMQAPDLAMVVENHFEAGNAAHRQNLEANHSIGKKNGNAVPPVPDDDIEQKIASRRRSMQSKAGGFCPKCGRPIQSMDRFCPHCGATLS